MRSFFQPCYFKVVHYAKLGINCLLNESYYPIFHLLCFLLLIICVQTHLSASINPIIYAFTNSEFRREMANGYTKTFLGNCQKPVTNSNALDERVPATGFAVIPYIQG